MMEFDGVLPSLITLLLLPSTAESMVVTGAVVSGLYYYIEGSRLSSVTILVGGITGDKCRPYLECSTRRWRTGNCGIRITCVSDCR